MSASNQNIGPSTDNFTAIFNAATNEYGRLTGKHLDTHPFATQLETCRSPEAISNIFRTQAQALSKFRKGDERLMTWLDPTIHILFTFSATLGEGIGLLFSPAKTIFTGIGVLLEAVRDVAAIHDTLIHIFERIHFFLQRLKSYTRVPLTNELTELLGKIMAQLLSVLALSTKEMTEMKIKKILKQLMGKKEIDDALLRLDILTNTESLMVVARNLEVTHRVDDAVRDVGGNVKAIKTLTEDFDDNVKGIECVTRSVDNSLKVNIHVTDEIRRNQLQEKLRSWLSPPDPSVNHNAACKTQHSGTAKWFIHGNTLQDWKKNGSLLWIRGNPGAGKSILCSAIIENIKNMREDKSACASVAYYYFDYKDASKRDLHGLLASLLFQLGDDSDCSWDVLFELYSSCHDGSEQPSDAALAKCLKSMLELPKQLPTFLIVDALDECPNTTGTPSPREEVLDFLEDLIGSGHPNLFICVTSRPEQDIKTALNPLTTETRRVSLHDESGQREDIQSYIRSFVHKNRAMRIWKEEDRELVITTLSERACGMFRWAFCQLDTLRRCMPSSIRKALDELPTTLDETYERALQGIPKERRKYAHHLFQCLVVAIRPLLVEELAELFAIEFDQDTAPSFKEGWRPENPEDAVLSTCSTLIAVIENEGSNIVQFSHFSVREFLTSDRLRISRTKNICQYYITLNTAHTILARACLTVLLQLDENVDKERLETFPLAFYSAQHWVEHAKYDDVASRIQNLMGQLFHPSNPYLAAWTWIHDVQVGETIITLEERPTPLEATALYYAVLCGFSGLANYLIVTHGEDVNAKCGNHGTPLHAASYKGHLDAASILLSHGVDVNATNKLKRTALCSAYDGGHLDVMRLLLEHGAEVDTYYDFAGPLLHEASFTGRADVVHLLLQHNADVNAKNVSNETPLHYASMLGQTRAVQHLLEHGAVVDAQSGTHCTPLYRASQYGCLGIVRILLGHGADVHIRGDKDLTPFQVATSNRHVEVAQLLLEHGAE